MSTEGLSNRLLLKNVENLEQHKPFVMRTVSKAASVNIFRDIFYKGWVKPDGAIQWWSGLKVRPLASMPDNMVILNTDYENYALVHTCLSREREQLYVLTRENFEEIVDPEIQKAIEADFLKFFGPEGTDETHEPLKFSEDIMRTD